MDNVANYQQHHFYSPDYSGIHLINANQGLIQRPNAIYEPQPKDPFYIIGENVLRPTIDTVSFLGSSVFNGITWGYTTLDRLLLRAINFIPTVQAVSSSDTQLAQMQESNKVNRQAQKIGTAVWSAVAINPKGFLDTIQNMDLDDKIAVGEDKELRESITEFNKLMTQINRFVLEKITESKKFDLNLEIICEARKAIKETLIEFANDLDGADRDRTHNFWKKPQQKLELDLSKNELRLNGKPEIARGTHHIDEDCHNVFMTEVLMDFFEKKAFMLGILNINDPSRITLEQFKGLFSKKVIDNLKTFVKEVQDDINENIQITETFVSTWTKNYSGDSSGLMDCVKKIFDKHKDIEFKNTGTIKVNLISIDDSRKPKEWEVFWLGNLYDTKLFSFSIIEPEKLRCEL